MRKWMSVMGRLTMAGLLAVGLCGCENNKSDHDHDDAAYDHDPAFNCSGSWATTLDDTAVGTTTLSMTPKGKLTGRMYLANSESGAINGHLSGYQAEWTVSFKTTSYLVSVTFNSSQRMGLGTIVTATGSTHALKLTR
ncbi:MAG: hypothetical protein ILO10_00700 [Kiritimatiellae bacterium]|nr:hypothetical protein [Kiritimatiellia bacterium]